MTATELHISARFDTSDLAIIRIIAKHLTALADELEMPGQVIRFDGELTQEAAEEFKARAKEELDAGKLR